jgi:nucleoid-associated protein YgaU
MIDTITYTPEGEVQVGGRGDAGSVLRVYLDNSERLTLQVPEDGRWVTTLPDTPPGIYALRVDQLDAAGKVTSRFETPFKRETIEALAEVAGAAATLDESEAESETAIALSEPAPESVPEPVAEPEPAVPAVEEPAPLSDPAPEAASDLAPESVTEPVQETVVAPPEPTTEIAIAPAATAPPETEPQMAELPAPDPLADTAPPVIPPPVTVTAQPGFTLWGIAQERYGNGVLYVQVLDANRDKIKDPDLIYPGQVFSVPEASATGSP